MSHIYSNSNYINLLVVVLFAALGNSAAADTIATKPLYLENDNAIEPNIVFTLDDSTSMRDNDLTSNDKTPTGNDFLDHTVNRLYYNPEITYEPWIKSDGTLYPAGSGATLCTKNSPCTYYKKTAGKPIEIKPSVTSYNKSATRSDCNTNQSSCTFTEESTNYANWSIYYSTRIKAAQGGIGRAFYALDDKNRVGYGTIHSPVSTGVKKFNATTKSAFFTWLYQFTGDTSGKGTQLQSGTPLRSAMKSVGEYYKATDKKPWADNPEDVSAGGFKSCRQSYHILMTDGYWNGDNGFNIGNIDNQEGKKITNNAGGNDYTYTPATPYKDTNANTLADVAMYYWMTDLQSGIDNKVSPNSEDPAFWQHMVNFTVSFGLDGNLQSSTTDEQNATLALLKSGSAVWTNPTTNQNTARIDDLWHAAVNSRGGFYNAGNPKLFVDALLDAFSKIQARTGSSSAMVSNTARLGTSSRIYQASFSSGDWSGELTAYPLNSSDGSLGAAVWQASTHIPAAGSRNLYTQKIQGNGLAPISFEWNNLDDEQKAALNNNAAGTNDGNGELRLAWLRGDQSRELSQPNGLFRTRTNLLGDIVNSSPVLVSNQDYGVGDASFMTSKGSRPSMVYVGANDGMLHAFLESTGEEQFAYIPYAIVPKLNKLTDKNYPSNHSYLVDGSPKVGDAKLGSQWKTVLLGSTGAGGKSVFALDVTDPANFSTQKILWEYTSANMGYALPQPTMGQLANDKWVALIANGYEDNRAGKLLVLDLANSDELKILTTSETSGSGTMNGLSNPVPVDLDGDRVTDLVYAGDLLGNLWRFDLRSKQSNSWSVSKIFTACTDATCSTSNRQPITARPMVIAHPNGGVMVLFATGSYFTNEDRSSLQLQALYGVWDKLEASPTLIAKSDLVQQSILAEVSATSTRIISNNEVNYGSKRGWYLDLLTPGLSTGVGERVITDIQLREDQLVVTSMLPSTDPCDYGGKSWLLELAPLTGSRLSYPVFDINNDGTIDSSDNQDVTLGDQSVSLPASGKGFDEILTKSAFVEVDDTTEIKYASGSSGSIKKTLEVISPNAKGRQSWRQLR